MRAEEAKFTRVNYGNEKERARALLAPGADRNRVIVHRTVQVNKKKK